MNKTDYNQKRAVIESGESVIVNGTVVSSIKDLDAAAEGTGGLTDAPDGTDALTLTRIVELEAHLDAATSGNRALQSSLAAADAQLETLKSERDELSEKLAALEQAKSDADAATKKGKATSDTVPPTA